MKNATYLTLVIADKHGHRQVSSQLHIRFVKHIAILLLHDNEWRGSVEEMMKLLAEKVPQFQLRYMAGGYSSSAKGKS